MDARLTHVNENGEARMVDVSDKAVTFRTAIAESIVSMEPETLSLITQGKMKKGDVFAVARLAGIMAAKKTSELIPLCHQLPLTSVTVELSPIPPNRVRVVATAKCSYQTGVEMEALTAASIAAHLYGASRGAAIIRAHDVAPHIDALKTWAAIEDSMKADL